MELYEYAGQLYPDYLKRGNAMQFVAPFAKQFCHGRGLDVGAGKWVLPGAHAVELTDGGDAYALPGRDWDFIFSSHCLEHLHNPIRALEHWLSKLRGGGTLFLYLPHPSMSYWLPENCAKHLHSWTPERMAAIVEKMRSNTPIWLHRMKRL